MMRNKVDKSSQTENKFFGEENPLLKLYHLRPRRKLIRYKRSSKPVKRVKSYGSLKLQIRKKQISSSSLRLQPKSSNSNHSSINNSLESSKSSILLTSDEELSNIRKKNNKMSKKISKPERPQTSPASLCLKIIDTKSENVSLNKKEGTMNSGISYEENNQQRAGVSLSDVVLRKKKSYLDSAHQSTSDKGLKLRFPRKRSIRTTLKDVLSSPKRKRRLIETSNQTSRDEEANNFIDLCSGSLEMSNDGFKQEKQKETFKENFLHENIFQEEKNFKQEIPSSFQDRGELGFGRNLNLMTSCFMDAINALHSSIIIKKEQESRDFNVKEDLVNAEEDKLNKGEVSELLSKMEEIVDVGTNDDAEKNGEAPEPGVERKVDRFRNLLEKISMLRRDVTILLEDAGKNDKTLEFFRNSRNFSRSSNDEAREGFVNSEILNRKLVTSNTPAQNPINPINPPPIQLQHEPEFKLKNKSTIDEDDDVQILKVIKNNSRSHFCQRETNLDGDYHFLLSLYQHLKKMPLGRKMKMRLKMQQLFYEEICTMDSD